MKCSNCGFETPEKINFCPVCATEINQSTSEVSQTSEVNSTPEVNQIPEINQTFEANQTSKVNQSLNGFPTDSQMQAENYILGIKDWFVGNVVLLVIASLATITSCCMNIFAVASLILSIIGVVYSNKVKSSIFIKAFDQATKDSKTAKTLFYVSLGILIFSVLVTISAIVFFIAIGYFSENGYSNGYN